MRSSAVLPIVEPPDQPAARTRSLQKPKWYTTAPALGQRGCSASQRAEPGPGPGPVEDHSCARGARPRIAVYGPLSRGEDGLLGAATRRAEAHVVRLAALYAALDTSPTITIPHLEAALAVWRYSLDSARWIFGDSLGDPTADEIWALAKDRPHGITRTEVRDLFSRNKKAREIDRALTVLEDAGRLRRQIPPDGRGRPAEKWVAWRPLQR